jgi:MFS family permease
MTIQAPDAAAGPRWQSLRALSVYNFRIYFLGAVVSVPGAWMQTTAQAWLVLKLTDSPFALATVASLQFLPVMLLSLIGGAVADRFPRRKLMLFTQSCAAVQACILGLLVVTGTINVWYIYAMAITLGISNALEAPLRQAFISELVPIGYLPNAIALQSMVQNLGRIIGPAIGGIVIAFLGVSSAFFLNGLTFAGTVTALLLIRSAELQPIKLAKKQNLILQVREGLSYARRTPSILFLLIAMGFIGLFGQNFTTMVPLISNYLVHASAAEFGLLNSCLGCGSFLAAAVLTTRGVPSARRILIAGFVFGAVLITISLSRNLVLSSAMFACVGAAAVTFSASVNTSLQIQAPPEMRGRLASMVSLLMPSPIGPLLTGAIAAGLGVGWAVFLNGVFCWVGIATAAFYLFRMRGKLGGFALPGTHPRAEEEAAIVEGTNEAVDEVSRPAQ